MGKFLAVLPAFLQMLGGYRIFRNSTATGEGLLISMYIFLVALCLLLYDIRLYPNHFRNMEWPFQTVIEYFIAVFLMENIVMDFWSPLESVITNEIIPRMIELLEDALKQREYNCDTFCDALRSKTVPMIFSYCLSLFFLVTVLHAIRAIDLRTLHDGPSCFIEDISYRLKKFFRKKMKVLGFSGKRRVRIKESTELPVKPTGLKNEPDENCCHEMDLHRDSMSEQDFSHRCDSQQFENDSYSDFDMAGFDD